jgi:hypothetical protein
MIRNVEDLYKYLLNLINKDKTHTINPDLFNLIINAALLNWVKKKLPLNDFKQIRIEDLNVLFVDGSLGDGIDFINDDIAPVPNDSLYNVRVVFDINYIDSPCFGNKEGKKQVAKLIKLDRLSAISVSSYSKPKDNRLYYNYSNNNVRLFTGKYSGESNSIGIKMYLDYYKYPDTITFIKGGDNASQLQFKSLQLQEIAEQAAQEFLEKNRDPRYQSYLNEQIQRNRI